VSAVVKSRIDPDLKRQADAVLKEIGLKPRAALELFYTQIIKRWAIPFPLQAGSPEDEVLSPAARTDARLALASVVLITTQFEDTPYEVTLPRVPWLREQSYINAQSLQPVKFTEFVRKASGKFDAAVVGEAQAAVKRWLKI
jgi:addiction module RelB/DinJ family antitoxin